MDFTEIARYLQVAVGIGLVIFVHESGHFIAARLCRVRVDVFSLGFGPKLLAWRRGTTTYQLALVPLGGYVKMAGEEAAPGSAPAPDDLRAKSVGQRFFIYSGGVLMNVAFGLVVFPMLLSHGVPFLEPLVGGTRPGGPAWDAKLEPGTRILKVNGTRLVGFEYLANEIALGPPEAATLEILEPGATEPKTVVVKPEYDEHYGLSTIGVEPGPDPAHLIEVAPNTPAARADLRPGDRLLAVAGDLQELPLQEQLGLAMTRAETLHLTLERSGEKIERTLTPERVTSKSTAILGVTSPYDTVVDLRVDSNADLRHLGLQRGDRLISVNGQRILRPGDLARALVSAEEPPQPVAARVRRGEYELSLTGPVLDRARALRLADDIALDLDTLTTEVVVVEESPAALAGLRDGDHVVAIDDTKVTVWDDLRELTKAAGKAKRELKLDVERRLADGSSSALVVNATPEPPKAILYGFGLREATYVYRAETLGEAVRVGFQSSWKFVIDAWTTIKRILLGQVSGENLGGIITIGAVSYNWASAGVAKLLFFLCMLSMNLAFLNVLPIPVLDGGHLFFLLVEKLKGSPVSERVLGYSQMVGLVLILSLMVYVTYNDLVRWVFND